MEREPKSDVSLLIVIEGGCLVGVFAKTPMSVEIVDYDEAGYLTDEDEDEEPLTTEDLEEKALGIIADNGLIEVF